MPAASIAAAVAGAGAIGASALGASASKKAANTAAAAQQQAATENNALQREIYSQNQAALSPYQQTGAGAMNQINQLLGITPGGSSDPTSGVNWAAYVSANPDAMNDYNTYHYGEDLNKYGQWHYYADGARRDLSGFKPQQQQTNANDAFAKYRDSTGYQFRLNEGMSALNSGFAGSGALQSGAAMKAAQRYGQNFASNEFGNYLNALGNQQGLGLSAASAQAGVGQNYANSISANNQNAADATSNAALARAANSNALYGTAAGVLGNVAGQFANQGRYGTPYNGATGSW